MKTNCEVKLKYGCVKYIKRIGGNKIEMSSKQKQGKREREKERVEMSEMD